MSITKLNSNSKSVFLTYLFLNTSILISAQNENSQDLAQYLFPEFLKGNVKMKAGREVTLILNYNTVTEKMVFEQKGQFYDMTNPETVDTVYIQNRKFIPVEKVFYEVLVNASVSLFIQQRSKLRAPGKPAGYGVTSEVAAITSVSGMNTETGYFNFKLPAGFVVKASPLNWIRVDNKMSSFLNERQFLKIFQENEEEIKHFIRQNKLKIEKREDMIKEVNYCNELMK